MFSFQSKGPKQTILIVDKDHPQLQTLIHNLQETRLNVVHISDGRKACEYCMRHLPAAIIMELYLPGFSGIQLFRQIKSTFITSHIPIMVTSKEDELDDRIKSMEMGIDDYIIKPYEPEEVVARVHSLLNETAAIVKSSNPLAHGFKGNLEEMNVVDLIKAMEMGRMSGIIYLNRGYKEGQIYINEGQIVDAMIKGFEPEQALSHMLTWLEGSFWVSLQNIDRNKMIQANNRSILTQGSRLIQRMRELTRQLPPLNTSLAATHSETGNPISPGEKQMLDHYEKPKTILQGIEESRMHDLNALELIRNLLAKGLLVAKHNTTNLDDPFARIVFEQLNRDDKQQVRESFTNISTFFTREKKTGEYEEDITTQESAATTGKRLYKTHFTRQELYRILKKLMPR